MKVLVIRFSSIGDILLCTPVIRCVRNQCQANITFLTGEKFKNLLSGSPYIDRIVTDAEGIMATRRWIQAQNFDLIIDLHKNRTSTLLTLGLSTTVIRYDKLNVKKWWYVLTKQKVLPDKHLVDRYFDALKKVNVSNDGLGLDFPLNPEAAVNDLPPRYNVIVLGAAHKTKRIPESIVSQWVQRSSFPVVLIGGADVTREGKSLCEIYSEKVINFTGQLTIDESAYVLSCAEKILTGDTGMMHLSAALKKSVIVLWGNTTPAFGMYPYYGNQHMIWQSREVPDLSCRPCSKLGFQECPKGHFKCMMLQKAEDW